MRLEISLSITALLFLAVILIKIKAAKNRKHLQAQEEIMDAQSKLLEEADALVSDESISDDDFYEKSKVISRKFDELKNAKPQA